MPLRDPAFHLNAVNADEKFKDALDEASKAVEAEFPAMAKLYYERLIHAHPQRLADLMARVPLEQLIEGRVKHLRLFFGSRLDGRYFDSINVIVSRALAAEVGIAVVCGASVDAMTLAYNRLAQTFRKNPATIARLCSALSRALTLEANIYAEAYADALDAKIAQEPPRCRGSPGGRHQIHCRQSHGHERRDRD